MSMNWPPFIDNQGPGPSLTTVVQAYCTTREDAVVLVDRQNNDDAEARHVTEADLVSLTANLLSCDPFAAAAATGTEVTPELLAELGDEPNESWDDLDLDF
ncbi:hypothetical protein KKF05_02180 [Patescibacteria group bacterium]|nr:hypothetical protein [Patescibacteria group bacterium]MBU1029519.1 hypothetical protein [Patescibacteria group bacterium]